MDKCLGNVFAFVEHIHLTALTRRKANNSSTWLMCYWAFTHAGWTHSDPFSLARWIAQASIVLPALSAAETSAQGIVIAAFGALEAQIDRSFRALRCARRRFRSEI